MISLEEFKGDMTFGDMIADRMSEFVGSWPFIIGQSIVIFLWVIMNSIWLTHFMQFDPYPFILLNLAFSFQAAYTGPIIMIAQNRKDKKQRFMMNQMYKGVKELVDSLHKKVDEHHKKVDEHLKEVKKNAKNS